MRRFRSAPTSLALALIGSTALFAACSESFDNTFNGTCGATYVAEEPQPGDPEVSLRLSSDLLTCSSGVTFGTLRGTTQMLIVDVGEFTDTLGVTRDSVTITGTSTVYNEAGDSLQSTFSGVGAFIIDEGPVDFVMSFKGTETYSGGTGEFDPGTGSSAVTGQLNFMTAKGNSTFNGTLTANNQEMEF